MEMTKQLPFAACAAQAMCQKGRAVEVWHAEPVFARVPPAQLSFRHLVRAGLLCRYSACMAFVSSVSFNGKDVGVWRPTTPPNCRMSKWRCRVQAYGGSSLSAGTGNKNLYDFLGLKFEPLRIA
jgi:hypothetical protein